METRPAPQLFSAEETELVECYRVCCSHHKFAIQLLAEALSKRCIATDNPHVTAFIKTQA